MTVRPVLPAGSRPPARTSPTSLVTRWLREDARSDIPASLVVFLVAVPLSLGIAVASGAPAAAGIIAAIIGGIVAGILGGAPLQVSGPAAGLVVVVAETIGELGWAMMCVVTVLAGLVQIALGALRVGRLALSISPTVVRGMLAGIGISIMLAQLNVSLGSSSGPTAWANLTALPGSIAAVDLASVVCSAGVLAVLVLWPTLPRSVQVLPAPLAAVGILTVVAFVAFPQTARVDLGGSLLGHVGLPELGADVPVLGLVGAVLTVSLIASVESLLSAVAVDKMHGGPRARLNRELLGQGAANSLSGLLGGLPVTGVIVRSATNVTAGARTRASAVLHGVWVALFALVLVSVVEQIPIAALAGLLVYMGVKLVKPSEMREARGRRELWIYVLTVVTVLALNLIEGVMIGFVAAVVVVLVRAISTTVTVTRSGSAPDGRDFWLVEARGTMSFLSMPRVVGALAKVPPGAAVEVDLLVDYLDPAIDEQIAMWRDRYVADGGRVELQRSGIGAYPTAAGARSAPATLRPWLPWAMWQPEHDDDGPRHQQRLAGGIREFHRRTSPTLRPAFDELADGQSPDAFFLSCVDSRVVPNLLTSSGPGDLFTVRTMGNVIPSGDDVSVSAALEYAVDHLGVPTLVVCGHSGCGAMAAALGEERSGDVGRWLHHVDPVLAAWRGLHPVGEAARERGDSEVDQLAQVNVAVAVERLRAMVADRPEPPEVVGLYFRIDQGQLWLVREDGAVPLGDAERERLVSG